MNCEDEVELSPEEELLKKHRTEKKELQAKIQFLKKSATKGDKKKKREVLEAIAKLERDLDDKQNEELNELKSTAVNNGTLPEVVSKENRCASQNGEQVTSNRISRAQKRRNKRQTEQQEREKRIQEQEENNKLGPRALELDSIQQILKDVNLHLYNIPGDGNCLYCAVNHQLEVTGREALSVIKLRKITANYMRDNKEDFIPFMFNSTDEPMTEEHFENYCNDVEMTKMWGGQLEIRALSSALKCPIKVIQANGPATIQGENFEGPPLILTYHRYLYRLGAHYNSTISDLTEEENELNSL